MYLEHKILNKVVSILYNGEYLTTAELAELPEVKKKGLTRGALNQRWKAGRRTEAQFFKQKRTNSGKRRTIGLKQLENLGQHSERKRGEVLISFCTISMFETLDFWDTKRIGLEPFKPSHRDVNFFTGKFPLFVQRSEIKERGWIVIDGGLM